MLFFIIVGDKMKRKRNKFTIGGSIGIIAMFFMSLMWPSTQLLAKIGALAIFAFICFAPLVQMKREGQDIEKNILFYVALLVVLAYLFFF